MSSAGRSRRPIVIAPDKFKGSLGALEVAQALERGFARVAGNDRIETRIVPMADGGEGTVAAFVDAGAQAVVRRVSGPLGAPVDATFALEDGLAVIEMAAASGLVLLAPQERDALRASTYGTGELIRAALDLGVRRLVIGIGGSATNDGGAGLLVALGARLLDERGMPLPPGGAALAALRTIDLSGLDPRLAGAEISVASDVDVPLCGPSGASAIFGPQKGASPEDVRRLDAALAHFADVTARTVSGGDHRDDPGAGAAGGLGFALIAFLGARFRPGVELIAELLGLDAALRGADLCLTGEGRIDEQTLRGKTVDGVARLARRYRVPVIAFGGSIDPAAEDELYRRGVVCCIPIVAGPITLETASGEAARLTEDAAARIARFWLAGQRPDDGEAETAAGTSAGLT